MALASGTSRKYKIDQTGDLWVKDIFFFRIEFIPEADSQFLSHFLFFFMKFLFPDCFGDSTFKTASAKKVKGAEIPMEKLPKAYEREYMRMAMLKHEETFKQQVFLHFFFLIFNLHFILFV